GGVEVEALMEVELDSETGLVDVEGASEPPQEEGDHPRIAVGQLHAAVGLRSLARVEGHRSQEQISVIERADHLPSPLVGGLDLGLLAALELVRGPAASALVAAPGPLAAASRQGASSMTTSRHQRLALDRLHPTSSAISARVQPWARRARARSCLASSPR